MGIAQATITFDAWKDGHVAPSFHEIPVVAPKSNFKMEAVSSRLKAELIHPNRTGNLFNIHFSPDGKRIIAGESEGVVVVWDVPTGKEVTRIETGNRRHRGPKYFHVSPDWKSLFVSREKEKRQRVEQGGKRLIRYEFDGEVRAWDLTTGALQRTYKHQPPRNILFMNLSPDGTRFLTFDELPGTYERSPRQAVSVWNVATSRYRSFPAGLEAMRLSKDWRTLAFASQNEDGYYSALKVIDVASGREKLSIPIQEKYRSLPYGQAMEFTPDGRSLMFAAMSEDGFTHALKLIDLATGREKMSIPITQKNVWCGITGFSLDSRIVAGSCRLFERSKRWNEAPITLKWWNLATGAAVGSFPLEEKNDRSFLSQFFPQFLPDGQTFAAVGQQESKAKLFFFREPGGQPMKTILLGDKRGGEQLIVRSPAFSPDGKWLALVVQALPDTREDFDAHDAPQPRIHLIDLASGSIRETLIAPQAIAVSACFSTDGKTLATGGEGRVLLWDLANLSGAVHSARRP